MTVFVLVGGFWIGAWAWRDVERRLRADGHLAYPLSLTGLAERRHLAGAEVGLDTHIADVVTFLEAEDLRDVVLVGHSGANVVIEGAAGRVPERLAGLVYVDTGPAADGVAVRDFWDDDERARTEARVEAEGEGWRIPLPPWEDFGPENVAGLDEAALVRFRIRADPHPWRAAADPLRREAAVDGLPKWAIACTMTVADIRSFIDGGAPGFALMGGPEWSLLDLPTGHWPMLSEPERLAAMLAAWPDAGRAAAVSARGAS